jgi:hypothetical protein
MSFFLDCSGLCRENWQHTMATAFGVKLVDSLSGRIEGSKSVQKCMCGLVWEARALSALAWSFGAKRRAASRSRVRLPCQRNDSVGEPALAGFSITYLSTGA